MIQVLYRSSTILPVFLGPQIIKHFKMLEGAVARLLNQLLGKYVVDLDTENLNVGIFSGHVQLTDLKLKTEALVCTES